MSRKSAAAMLATSVALASVPGLATSLGGLTGGTLGAGGAIVSACDADGFTVAYATSGASVTSVTVSGIADPGCEGGQLSLTLADGGASIGAAGPQIVPTDGDSSDNSMTLNLSPQPAASAVNTVHVVITGP